MTLAADKFVVPDGLVNQGPSQSGQDMKSSPWGDPEIAQSMGTGLISGGLMSINIDTSKFDISAGVARIIDDYSTPARQTEPVVTEIVIAAAVAIVVSNITTDPITRVKIDIDGNVLQQTTPLTDDDYRDFIVLGSLFHSDLATISSTTPEPFIPIGYSLLLMFVRLHGALNIRGNRHTPNGVNLQLNRDAGEAWRLGANYAVSVKDPNTVVSPAAIALSFFQVWDDGTGLDLSFAFKGVIDPTVVDDGSGVLSVFGGGPNQATLRFVFFFPTSNTTVIRVGTTVYATLSDAVANAAIETPSVTEDFSSQGVHTTTIAVIQGAADLSDSTKAVFIPQQSIAGQF